MNSIKGTFTRNLRGYLSAARIGGAFSTGRVSRSSKSLTDAPIEPIDAIFSTLSNGDNSAPDQLTGYQSITQHLLARNVLDNLLQVQNEISAIGEEHKYDAENTAKAIRNYKDAQDSFAEMPNVTYLYTH